MNENLIYFINELLNTKLQSVFSFGKSGPLIARQFLALVS